MELGHPQLTVDHLISPPKVKEGKHSLQNLLTCCVSCNTHRSRNRTYSLKDAFEEAGIIKLIP